MVRKLKVGATMAMDVFSMWIAMFLLWAPVVMGSIHCACTVGGSFDCTRVEQNIQDAVYALFNGNCIRDCSTRNCEQAFYTFTTYINSCPLPPSLTTSDYPVGVVKRGYGPICKPCIIFGTPQCTGGSEPATAAPPVLSSPQTPVTTAAVSAPPVTFPAIAGSAGAQGSAPPAAVPANGNGGGPAAASNPAGAGAAPPAPAAAASRPAGDAVQQGSAAAAAPLTITRPDGCVCPAPASGSAAPAGPAAPAAPAGQPAQPVAPVPPNQPANPAPASAAAQPARAGAALSGATSLTFSKLFVSFFVLSITSVLLRSS